MTEQININGRIPLLSPGQDNYIFKATCGLYKQETCDDCPTNACETNAKVADALIANIIIEASGLEQEPNYK